MDREEAIRRIRAWNLDVDDLEVLGAVIPELRESEDERIRKAILGLTYIDGIEPILTKCSITAQDIRAYLEKQKEQKPAEWSEEDEAHIESLLKRLDGMCKKGATFTQTRFAVSEDMDWIKSLSLRSIAKHGMRDNLLKPIDTLEEEPDKDLEKEIARYCQSYYNCIYPEQLKEGNCWVGMPHIVEAARHFAKWQKERGTFMGPIHEKCSQCPYDRDVVFWKGMQYAIAGMKEDAVEGIYTKSMDGKNVFVESGALKIDPASVKVGDPVRIIVLPKED